MHLVSRVNQPEIKLNEWIGLEDQFIVPPSAQLVLQSSPLKDVELTQRDVAISSAIQCYSPELAVMKSRTSKPELKIGRDTLDAGHLTTRQHHRYTWRLSGVSRETVHSILHAFPHYNTEQQSQRYVEAREASLLIPKDLPADQHNWYSETARFSFESYKKLIELLRIELIDRIHRSWPKSALKNDETINKKVSKLSQEIARYVLPIGQTTNMFYSLDVMTLMRLFASTNMCHFTDEAKYLVASMIKAVGQIDPTLIEDLPIPVDYPRREPNYEANKLAQANFDIHLGNWEMARVLTESRELTRDLNASLGFFEDSEESKLARQRLLSPESRPNLASPLRHDWHDTQGSLLNTVAIQTMFRLSHTADSQRQRHRTTNTGVIAIDDQYTGDPDYHTPMVINQTPQIKGTYDNIMEIIYDKVQQGLNIGVPRDWAMLMLPNAQRLRMVEVGNLLGIQHRSAQRLCHLAQEEISMAVWEQTEQIQELLGFRSHSFGPPCTVRFHAGIRPPCPEGDRFCMIPVWKQDPEDYWNKRLF